MCAEAALHAGAGLVKLYVSPDIQALCAASVSPEIMVGIFGQPRALLVDSDETKLRPLAEALRREKIQAETRAANGLPLMTEDQLLSTMATLVSP